MYSISQAGYIPHYNSTGAPGSNASLPAAVRPETTRLLASAPGAHLGQGEQGVQVPLPGRNANRDDLIWHMNQLKLLAPHNQRVDQRQRQATAAYEALSHLERSRNHIASRLQSLNSSLADALGSRQDARGHYISQLNAVQSQISEQDLRLNMAVRDLRHRPITRGDKEPYLELERQHPDLFASDTVKRVAENAAPIKGIVDVDMDEYAVINAADMALGFRGLGTKGLGPCVAITAQGKDAYGRPVLGMTHFSGIATASDAFAELDMLLREKGAQGRLSFTLAGGMIMPHDPDDEESESGSLENETALLGMRAKYNITGARLHVCEGEQNPITGEDQMSNTVSVPGQTYFRYADLY